MILQMTVAAGIRLAKILNVFLDSDTELQTMLIQKALSHKYIRRIPKKSGKGYWYIYSETFKKPFQFLLNVFNLSKERIDKEFEQQHIEKEYGADKQTYCAHILEYLTNRAKWDTIFAQKEKREQYKKAVNVKKTKTAHTEKVGDNGQQSLFPEKKEKKQSDTLVINRSLMYKVWSLYNKKAAIQADTVPSQTDVKEAQWQTVKSDLNLLNGILESGQPATIHHTTLGAITVDAGTTGKSGYGIKHIIEQRYAKDGKNEDEIAALCLLITDALKDGTFRKNDEHFAEIKKNSIMAVVSKQRNGNKEQWLLTGYDLYDEKAAATDAIQAVIAMHGYTSEFSGLKKQVGAVIASLEKSIPQTPPLDNPDARSEAMKGNENAKKDVSKAEEKRKEAVSPQTDKQMKAEKKAVEKDRENAGFPQIHEELGERTSVVDDLSWNPNDENYRYKDTGYIAGARKELALSQIRLAGRNKERLRDTDIDWEGVEENKRAAKKVITKSNIFGQVDWDSLKENGMTGGAAFLIDRVYAMIGKEPAEDSAEARRAYVIGVNGLRDRLESAKTVQDVENTLIEIGEEMAGRFHSVRDTDEYKERAKKIAKLREKVEKIKNKDDSLSNASEYERLNARSRADQKIRKYLTDRKVIKWNQKWWGENELSKFSSTERVKFRNFQEQVEKEEFTKYHELLAACTRFEEENGYIRSSEERKYVYPNGHWTYIDFPIERELLDAEQNLELWEKTRGAAAMLENPLYKAWYQLGDKFKVITQHSYRNKTFYQHKADARRGTYDNWEWLKKDTIEISRKGRERKSNFEFIVAKEFNRKGGRNVTAKSTQELKELFNLRDVQSGNWVLKDPESAKWHVDRMTEAFADLCDVTGIPDNLVSLNGRLAVAIGARGTGGEGAAKAHYEPIQRVINITKMKGGGSLGHEWFHAFDNMIMEAMGGTEGQTSSFMTNKYAHLTPTQKKLLQDYLAEKENIKNVQRNWDSAYTLAKLKIACGKKGISIPETPKEEFQVKVVSAFDGLVYAMTKGNVSLFEKLTYSESDWNKARYNIFKQKEGSSSYTFGNKIYDAGSFEKAMQIINERFDDDFSQNRLEWARMAAAFYNGKPENKYNTVFADLGHKGTDFFQKAILMDIKNPKGHLASTHEMAARAFSAYIDDKLREQDRFNDYLANYTDNKYYQSPLGDAFPFPEGEERKKINQAFDSLFAVIKKTGAIRKALQLADNALFGSNKERDRSFHKAIAELEAAFESFQKSMKQPVTLPASPTSEKPFVQQKGVKYVLIAKSPCSLLAANGIKSA